MKSCNDLLVLVKKLLHENENESNWSTIDKTLIELSQVEDKYYYDIMTQANDLILRSLLSERSKLSGSAVVLGRKLLNILKNEFYNPEKYIEACFKLLARPNKVFNIRAKDFLIDLAKTVNIMNHIRIIKDSMTSLSKRVRAGAFEIVFVHIKTYKVDKNKLGPLLLAIQKGKGDSDLECRNICKGILNYYDQDDSNVPIKQQKPITRPYTSFVPIIKKEDVKVINNIETNKKNENIDEEKKVIIRQPVRPINHIKRDPTRGESPLRKVIRKTINSSISIQRPKFAVEPKKSIEELTPHGLDKYLSEYRRKTYKNNLQSTQNKDTIDETLKKISLDEKFKINEIKLKVQSIIAEQQNNIETATEMKNPFIKQSPIENNPGSLFISNRNIVPGIITDKQNSDIGNESQNLIEKCSKQIINTESPPEYQAFGINCANDDSKQSGNGNDVNVQFRSFENHEKPNQSHSEPILLTQDKNIHNGHSFLNPSNPSQMNTKPEKLTMEAENPQSNIDSNNDINTEPIINIHEQNNIDKEVIIKESEIRDKKESIVELIKEKVIEFNPIENTNKITDSNKTPNTELININKEDIIETDNNLIENTNEKILENHGNISIDIKDSENIINNNTDKRDNNKTFTIINNTDEDNLESLHTINCNASKNEFNNINNSLNEGEIIPSSIPLNMPTSNLDDIVIDSIISNTQQESKSTYLSDSIPTSIKDEINKSVDNITDSDTETILEDKTLLSERIENLSILDNPEILIDKSTIDKNEIDQINDYIENNNINKHNSSLSINTHIEADNLSDIGNELQVNGLNTIILNTEELSTIKSKKEELPVDDCDNDMNASILFTEVGSNVFVNKNTMEKE
ncbi:hypothetical protein SLOPH_1863 [Spraguea lophii 42_110]|uniref:CLASP N-terminal domain-containing protein n=1 Tax=Spraguea lophii (strain 42_110) TaxID=1358809 RepID=S7W4W5_SPRLO|nr:hypothetical protein SLOPH_1863 [Spraguea lophii 42_110]